jgi:hypothetical protein
MMNDWLVLEKFVAGQTMNWLLLACSSVRSVCGKLGARWLARL